MLHKWSLQENIALHSMNEMHRFRGARRRSGRCRRGSRSWFPQRCWGSLATCARVMHSVRKVARLTSLLYTPQKRSLQERITELEAAHAAQKENVLSQYQALLRQVRRI